MLVGWVVGILLGTILLFVKLPADKVHFTYRRAKNTCAITIILFGLEILFQWLIRFYFELNDPALSLSVYLMTFCVATLIFTGGFCTMLAPHIMDKKQRNILLSVLAFYGIYLLINYFIDNRRIQSYGILIACAILLVITCISIYKFIYIYRHAINDLKTYYADVVENLMRWMPGVGAGVMLLLIAAPITCLCPRWVGINQLAMGIVLFIYTFIYTIEFSFSYNTVAAAIHQQPEVDEPQDAGNEPAKSGSSSLSASLQDVMQGKEARWREQGGYRTAGLTIEQAARAMGTNRSYLSRYLNEVRQMNFYEWVAHMRIDEAQSIMVQERETSIEQIASRLGFTSVSTFSSTFKKVVGESPVKWRNAH
ncbi:MAG: helix-turn-helix transcriptional regulator [Muribaculaceae bacterium]|nr:helix-turn-helix transcriptional regulator [Muribaculaceae bacterium]